MLLQKSLTKKKLWLCGGIIVMTLIALGFTYWVKTKTVHENPMAKYGVVKPLVAVETVKRQDMMKRIVLSGQTVAEAQVDIVPKYAGHISQVNVELGQAVSAGQVLAIEDTRDVELLIAKTEAVIRQAKAETMETTASFTANYQKLEADYQRNLDNYQRYESLYTTGAISLEALDVAKQQMINARSAFHALDQQGMTGGTPATLEIKQAALSQAECNLEILKKQREDMILRAPRSGIIGMRQVEVGAFVQASQKILTIVDNKSIYIDCQVSEQNAAQIRGVLEVPVTIDSLAKQYTGKMIYTSPAIDDKVQVFTVRLALMQGDALIKSGMFAHAKVDVLLKPHTLFVAKEAILEKDRKKYVFVINANHQAEQRLVEVGLRNDDAVEILSGIQEGEQIAISNITRLKQDVTVELEQKNNTQPKGSMTKQSGGTS